MVLDSPVSDDVVRQIREIDTVYRVRV